MEILALGGTLSNFVSEKNAVIKKEWVQSCR